MKGAKYILTAAVIAMSSVMMTGCFKPSKDAVVESKYYQSLKDERDKLSVQLKEEKKKTNSLNKKIKAIHATSGDQKIADYKSRVKDSRIIKVDFATNTIKNQSFAVTNIPVCKYVKKIVTGCNRMIGITPTDVEKQYKQSYSYALIDEDNTTFEFKVYGDSYIVFDEIPENVYAYNGASTVGDALIDAKEQKNYSNVAARIASMKWKEVDPEQEDWEKQIDIVAYYGSITVGSIVYCGEEIGWQSVIDGHMNFMQAESLEDAKREMIDILEEHCTDQINYYKDLQGHLEELNAAEVN